jgi:hypothetical protein
MMLATNLIDALKQNSQNTAEVLPPYNYYREFTHIIAEGLRIDQAIIAEGLGVCCG